MSARILVHPRCVDGPAAGVLAAHLQERGYDLATVVVGPAHPRLKHAELCRIVDEKIDKLTLDRMDGTRIERRTETDPLEAA